MKDKIEKTDSRVPIYKGINSKDLTPIKTSYNKNDIVTAVNKETGEVTKGIRFYKGFKEGFTMIAPYNPTEIPFLWRNEKYDFYFEKKGEPDPPLRYKAGDLFREKYTGDIIEIYSKKAGKYQWKYPGEKYGGELSISQKGLDNLFEPVKGNELSKQKKHENHKQNKKTMENKKEAKKSRLERFNELSNDGEPSKKRDRNMNPTFFEGLSDALQRPAIEAQSMNEQASDYDIEEIEMDID